MAARLLRMACAATASIGLLVGSYVPTLSADLIAPGPYTVAPADSLCARDSHLRAIERGFDIQAREVHHRPELEINLITDFRENRFLPKVEDVRAVSRLYCQATAHMSDGHARKLWYLIEYDEGFAGFFGDNVEFCLSGLDDWNVYNGNCRVLR
ncbi:phage portal protein [Oricola cellulosilytica]|uniref:phage portal protein n=1 Tax=Oricola cellulosilytica TaxID=1429082 RepID=UPI0018EE8437|nr:phage portal protein [Oricola cellulosilytica]